MPPTKTVTADGAVDVLEEVDKPFATTSDLADGLGVTNQTIRNNADLLASDSRISKGEVAQSSVYWLAGNETPEQAEPEPGPPTGGSRSREFESEPTETEESDNDGDSGSESGFRRFIPTFEMVMVRVAALSFFAASVGFFSTIATVLGQPFVPVTVTLALFAPAVGLVAVVALLTMFGIGIKADLSVDFPNRTEVASQ